MWTTGTLKIGDTEIKFECKHFDEPSFYGIEDGRISKLMLRQGGKIVYNYDRGLDIEPQTKEAEEALKILMEKFN